MQAGIDLGTGGSKEAVTDPQGNPCILRNEDGDLILPSVVFFEENGNVLFGKTALSAGSLDPARCVMNAKRYIGTDKVLFTSATGEKYYAKDIQRLLFEKVREIYSKATGGGTLKKVAVSHPANFTANQISETKEAAEAAGLEVLVMVKEPTAASFGHLLHRQNLVDARVLVIDQGAGTLDVTVLTASGCTIEAKETLGAPKLGCIDFDDVLVKIVTERWKEKHHGLPDETKDPLFFSDLRGQCERGRIQLTLRDEAQVMLAYSGKSLSAKVTYEEFKRGSKALLAQFKDTVTQAIKEKAYSFSDFHTILLVGGGSQMRLLQEATEELTGRKPTLDSEPQFTVAKGVYIMGRIVWEGQGHQTTDLQNRRLPPVEGRYQETTSHPIGVKVVTKDGRYVNAVILEKGKRIPADYTVQFKLAEPGATSALIELYEGLDNAPIEVCSKLGEFELKDLTPVYDRDHPVDIRLKLDLNSLLAAEAYDPISSKSAQMQLTYTKKEGPCAPVPVS